MNDEQKNQSVKDILEDIKKAISGKTNHSCDIEKQDEKKDNGSLHIEEEYLQSNNDTITSQEHNETEDEDVLNLEEEYLQSNNDTSNSQEHNETEDDDVLNLEEEYLQSNNDTSNSQEYNETEEDDDVLNLEEEYEQQEESDEEDRQGVIFPKEETSKQNLNVQEDISKSNTNQESNYSNLILQKNIEEIKSLLGEMKSQLQQSKPMLTVEELVTSLLKPELSEWLNKHLYSLVKEVVEKELKSVLNYNK